MSKEELLGKELCNLYAIAKHVNSYFDNNDIKFLSESGQHLLTKYRGFSQANESLVLKSLRNLGINPGNTTDSVVLQIIENLEDTASQKEYNDEVKSMGYVMSLNRLISYHAANIQNLEYGSRNL